MLESLDCNQDFYWLSFPLDVPAPMTGVRSSRSWPMNAWSDRGPLASWGDGRGTGMGPGERVGGGQRKGGNGEGEGPGGRPPAMPPRPRHRAASKLAQGLGQFAPRPAVAGPRGPVLTRALASEVEASASTTSIPQDGRASRSSALSTELATETAGEGQGGRKGGAVRPAVTLNKREAGVRRAVPPPRTCLYSHILSAS